MAYVDGFVAPVPTKDRAHYQKGADRIAALFVEHGALSSAEFWGEDVPYGKLTSFPRSVQATEDESVVLAIITYRDRAHRDEVQQKVFADPRFEAMMEKILVDGARMIFGGFEQIVSR